MKKIGQPDTLKEQARKVFGKKELKKHPLLLLFFLFIFFLIVGIISGWYLFFQKFQFP